MEYAKHFDGNIQVVEESWPKLFQPDYTEVVTKVLNSKADAMYSALWGGDLSAFIDQGNLYGLFDKQLMQGLDALYDALNLRLIDAGVLPNLKFSAVRAQQSQAKPVRTRMIFPLPVLFSSDMYLIP